MLTPVERDFIDHYDREIIELEKGPASEWLLKHGVFQYAMRPFIEARQRELATSGATEYPPRPGSFDVPWSSIEDLQKRCMEIEVRLNSGVANNRRD